MSMLDIFKQRRSIKKYISQDIPNEELRILFEAARWAPSAHNAQPWRFIVIKNHELKMKLAEAMAKAWNNDLIKDGIPIEIRKNLIKDSIEKFVKAPIIIIVCLTMDEMHKYPDEHRQKIEHIMAIQSVAASIQNILLAAHLRRLGSCWFCAPLFCQDVVRKILMIPDNIEIQALITIGYPDEKPQIPSRKNLNEIVYENYWGNVF